jgi:hypothetical protein
MNAMNLFIDVLVLVLVYLVIANRLLAVGAHFRSRALDLGAQLLADPQVPADVKENIENWLCDIPKTGLAWFLNLVMTPLAIIVVISRWAGISPPTDGVPLVNSSYWKKWDDFITMAVIATLCNSPLAFALGIFQLLFTVSLLRSNYVVWVAVGRMIQRDGFFGRWHRHA